MSTESKSAGEAVRVAAALIARDGRLLAARRASGDQAGLWELPGGKLRAGERSDAALRREVREELGCELGVAWLYDTLDYDYPDFHLTMDCFVCRLADRSPMRAFTPSCDGSRARSSLTSSGCQRTSR